MTTPSPSLLATYAPSLNRIIVAVRDLRAAVRFHTQVLGFAVEKFRRRAGHPARFAILSAGSLRVVLVQSLNEESFVFQFTEEFGPGVYKLVVDVNDLHRLAEDLASRAKVEWQEREGRLVIPRDVCSGMEYVFFQRAGDNVSGACPQGNVTRGPWERSRGL